LLYCVAHWRHGSLECSTSHVAPACSQLGHGTDSSEWQQPNVDLVEPV
jgi:hypothetical protein